VLDLVREPTIYLIPECDTNEDVADVLRGLCEEIFEEQLGGWTRIHQPGYQAAASKSFAGGSTINTIPCLLISATNRWSVSEDCDALSRFQRIDTSAI
jgi:hypothetical protein